jgi:hypothetical protein
MMIPKALLEKPNWVVWKSVDRGGKATKIPFQPNGQPASSTNPETWRRFDDVIQVEDQWSGLGFVFCEGQGLVGIDLDGCRDPKTGVIEDWALAVIDKMDTYTEVSPSKTGVKMFGLASKAWSGVNKVSPDVKAVCDKAPGIEVYDKGRYFAVTGDEIEQSRPIANVDDSLEWLRVRFSMAQKVYEPQSYASTGGISDRAAKYVEKCEPAISGQRGSDRAFAVACVLVGGFALSVEEAFRVFWTVYNPKCQPPWSEREVKHKIDSAAKKCDKVGWLVNVTPDKWQTFDTKKFIPQEPPVVREVKKNTLRGSALEYLGNVRSGVKPLHTTGVPLLDRAIGGGIADGELVIIGARPSHGKSCIALQMVHEFTAQGKPVLLVSEEMSALQLGKRAIQFATGYDSDNWKESIDKVQLDVLQHFQGRAEAFIAESCGNVDTAIKVIDDHVSSHGVKAVFIDYAQLLQGKGNTQYERVTNVSVALKQASARHGIPFFVLAQLSRKCEDASVRKTFLPKPSDLKDSGQLEQDADVILLCAWPWKVDASQPKNQYWILVAKNRNREIVDWKLDIKFDPSRQMLLENQPARYAEFD